MIQKISMATLETGVFIFMIAFSFGFMIWGFLRSAGMLTYMLRMVSIVMFFGLAMFIVSGYGVAETTTITSQTLDSNNSVVSLSSTHTEFLIPEGSDGSWLGWVFLGFGFISMGLIVKDVFEVAKH